MVAPAVPLSACGSASEPERTISYISPMQMRDATMTCPQFEGEIQRPNGDIALIDQEIADSRSSATTNTAMGAIAGLADVTTMMAGGMAMGDRSGMMSMMASSDEIEADRLESVKLSYQDRRQVLMGRYFENGCG